MTDATPVTDRPKDAGQSLPEFLGQTFAAQSNAPFAEKFVGLTAALLNTRKVYLFASPNAEDMPPTPLATTTESQPRVEVIEAATRCFSREKPDPAKDGLMISCQLALPESSDAALVVELPQNSSVVQGLAYERLSILQALASARFANPELDQMRKTMAAALDLADPTDASLQRFADHLAALTEADFAAVGRFDGAKINHLALSGQADGTSRAILPDRLRRDMAETGRKKLSSPLRRFLGPPGQDHGLVLELENPRRNRDLISLVAAAVTVAAPSARPRISLWKRSRRWVLSVLFLGAICLIPLPDEVSTNATVTAESFRIVTAPFSASLIDIEVSDNAVVLAGETILARMDTSEIGTELIAAQADYASALLSRETARANRDAATLRNAELEVERIAARIALLNIRQDAAELVAPISGLVIGPDLQAKRGSVVNQGDPLLQIADPDRVRLDVDISQADLSRVTDGMTGRFRPDFDPSLAFDITLTTISPAALDTDRAPVFSARATIDQDAAQLRHGMTGVVSVDRKWRPAGLILWDGIRDWVMLRLWL